MAQSGVIASPVSSPYHQRNRTPPKQVPKFCQALSDSWKTHVVSLSLFCALLQYLPGQVLVPDKVLHTCYRPLVSRPSFVSLPCHYSSSDSPASDSLYSRAARPGALRDRVTLSAPRTSSAPRTFLFPSTSDVGPAAQLAPVATLLPCSVQPPSVPESALSLDAGIPCTTPCRRPFTQVICRRPTPDHVSTDDHHPVLCQPF
jgi:hypothetical protein